MNKVILAAIAASFMSTAASAHSVQLPTEGQVCSDIHSNISVGINNPELSDYRKCVMIQHGIDTAFTYKTFWVRTGDHFTSFPVETLAKMNRAERIDYIGLSVQQGLLIEMLEGELAASQEMILDLQLKLGEAFSKAELDQAEIMRITDLLSAERDRVAELERVESALNDDINDLTIKVDQFREISNNNAANATYWHDEAKRLESLIAGLNAQIAAGGDFSKEDIEGALLLDYDGNFDLDNVGVSVTLNEDGTISYVELTNLTDIVVQGNTDAYNQGVANGKAQIRASATASYDVARGELRLTIQNVDGYKFIYVTRPDGSPARTLVDDTSIGATGKKSTSSQHGNAAYQPTQGGLDTSNDAGLTSSASRVVSVEEYDDQSGLSEYTSVDGYKAIITIDTRDDKSASLYDSDLQLVDGVYQIETDDFINESISDFNKFVTQLADRVYDAGYADGFAAGYDEGFEDGYESGYADGYHDGYHDGVESVK